MRRERRPERKPPRRNIDAPLKGLLRCGHCGGTLIPTFSVKNGKRYYYYICAKDVKRGHRSCPVSRFSSALVEKVVYAEVSKVLRTRHFVELLAQGSRDRREVAERALSNIPMFWNALFPIERTRILHLLVREIVVYKDHFHVVIDAGGVGELVGELTDGRAVACEGGLVAVDVPIVKDCQSGQTCLVVNGWAEVEDGGLSSGVLKTIANGYHYLSLVESGEMGSSYDFEKKGIARHKIAERAMRIAWMSPVIVHKILAGELPNVSITKLLAIGTPIWAEQHAALGID